MKKVLVSMMLIAFFALSFAFPGNAFFHPGSSPTDDSKFNNYGPKTDQLTILPFASQQDEYTAFENVDDFNIDFMDQPLLPSQYGELVAEDEDMVTYARAFSVSRGMKEFDLNNQKFPTSDPVFRRALSHSFDKNSFIATCLAGLAVKMDSPLQNHGGYYNPYCTDLYLFDLLTAASILDAAGYVDQDSDGWREGPGGEEIRLDFYIRQDDAPRLCMGRKFAENLITLGIDCHCIEAGASVCTQKVMVEFDYHIYTGGWSFGRDPTTICPLYYGTNAQAYPNTPNYPGYYNPAWDVHADSLLSATEVGDDSTPCTAIYHAWEMQRILMDDAGVIPVFSWATYGAYKSAWDNVVNEVGVGPWSWYTFLNTEHAVNTNINWGFASDITDCNPIHSLWQSDWNLLNLVYDTLIHSNPYDNSQDMPWLAKSWAPPGTWDSDTKTKITFKLREDVYWQDAPGYDYRTLPGGTPGSWHITAWENEQFNAEDVVFTINALKALGTSAKNYALVENVKTVTKDDPFTVTVYMDCLMPLTALHLLGSLPILPEHIWSPIYAAGKTADFDAIGQQCLVGTGPWKYNYALSAPHVQYVLDKYPRFFRIHPIDMTVVGSNVVNPGDTVSCDVFLHNMDAVDDPKAPGKCTVTVEMTDPSGTTTPLLTSAPTPALSFCVDTLFYHYSGTASSAGLYVFSVTITPDDPDVDGYKHYVWCTTPEDINLDFYVNAKDAVRLGSAFGAREGDPTWDPSGDINKDSFINAKDAVLLGGVFGWHG